MSQCGRPTKIAIPLWGCTQWSFLWRRKQTDEPGGEESSLFLDFVTPPPEHCCSFTVNIRSVTKPVGGFVKPSKKLHLNKFLIYCILLCPGKGQQERSHNWHTCENTYWFSVSYAFWLHRGVECVVRVMQENHNKQDKLVPPFRWVFFSIKWQI